jgi:hypothetical protein
MRVLLQEALADVACKLHLDPDFAPKATSDILTAMGLPDLEILKRAFEAGHSKGADAWRAGSDAPLADPDYSDPEVNRVAVALYKALLEVAVLLDCEALVGKATGMLMELGLPSAERLASSATRVRATALGECKRELDDHARLEAPVEPPAVTPSCASVELPGPDLSSNPAVKDKLDLGLISLDTVISEGDAARALLEGPLPDLDAVRLALGKLLDHAARAREALSGARREMGAVGATAAGTLDADKTLTDDDNGAAPVPGALHTGSEDNLNPAGGNGPEMLAEAGEAALVLEACVLEAALEVNEAEAQEVSRHDHDAGTTSTSTTGHACEQSVVISDTSTLVQQSDSSSGATDEGAATTVACEQGANSTIAGSAAGAQDPGKAKRRRSRGGRKGKASKEGRQQEQDSWLEASPPEEQQPPSAPPASAPVRKPSYAAALMKSLLGLPEAQSPVTPEQSPRKATNNDKPSAQPQRCHNNESVDKTRGGPRRQGKGASTQSNVGKVSSPARPAQPPSDKALGSARRRASYAEALVRSPSGAGSTVVPTVIVSPVVSPGHVQQRQAPPTLSNKAGKSWGGRNSNSSRGKTSV